MSFKTIIAQQSEEDVRAFLEANADFIKEDELYTRRLTDEELTQLKDELAEASVKLAILEAKKKDFLEQMKEETNPLQGRNKVIIGSLRTKVEEVEGIVFEFKNLDDGTVEQFDKNGQYLGSRRMRPDEDDGRIAIMRSRTGTNG